MIQLKRRPAGSSPPTLEEDIEIKPCGLCQQCVHHCPTGALRYHLRVWTYDIHRCIYCRECVLVCPNQLITEA